VAKGEKGERKYGHKKLIVWKEACKLRRLVYKITKPFSYSERRRTSQMQDAARSIRDNITEGYYRTLNEYIRFLEISKAPSEELGDQIEDCWEDELIDKTKYNQLKSQHQKTSYLLDRLLASLRRKRKEGGWKKRI
jgi:four helix bundle protein